MLSVFTTNNNNLKRGQEETFEGDRCAYGIDSGDGLMGIYISPNSSSYMC